MLKNAAGIALLTVLAIIVAHITLGCSGTDTDARARDASYAAGPGTATIVTVPPREIKELIARNRNSADFSVIDLRTPGEHASGHIPGSRNIDFRGPTFRTEMEKLPRSGKYVIFCRSGGRSGRALDMMRELGFESVYNLQGGMMAWRALGYPSTN